MVDNLTSEEMNSQERRSSLRLDMESELVVIYLKNAAGVEKEKHVTCVDISNGGLAVNSDEAIEIGSLIKVKTNPQDTDCPIYNAKVLRCDVQGTGWYNIGFVFQAEKLNDK